MTFEWLTMAIACSTNTVTREMAKDIPTTMVSVSSHMQSDRVVPVVDSLACELEKPQGQGLDAKTLSEYSGSKDGATEVQRVPKSPQAQSSAAFTTSENHGAAFGARQPSHERRTAQVARLTERTKAVAIPDPARPSNSNTLASSVEPSAMAADPLTAIHPMAGHDEVVHAD